MAGLDLHHTSRPDLFAVQQINRTRETISLGERTNDAAKKSASTLTTSAVYPLDFIHEDPGWRPRDTGLVLVNTIHEECTTTVDVVNGMVYNLLYTSALGDNVKAVY